jgi:hypothetical protein
MCITQILIDKLMIVEDSQSFYPGRIRCAITNGGNFLSKFILFKKILHAKQWG